MKLFSIRTIKITIILLILAFFLLGFYAGLEVTYYTYKDSNLPSEFNGYRIVFLSDFHCKSFGTHESTLINKIKNCNPDLIVITGDTIDSKHSDLTPVSDLLAGIQGLCPIYAISGNHEFDSMELFSQLKDIYTNYGVIFLDNAYTTLSKGNSSIGLYGARYEGQYYTDQIKAHTATNTSFNILLSHDAGAFQATSTFGYNLVLSGHLHGGVIRLPLIGGLLRSDGTLFAQFEAGAYHLHNSTLLSNRGLGDSIVPRFYNRPEVVCITLLCK